MFGFGFLLQDLVSEGGHRKVNAFIHHGEVLVPGGGAGREYQSARKEVLPILREVHPFCILKDQLG